MSESTFPFGASADSEPFPLEQKAADSRKPLVVVVGGLMLALVVGAGGFLLLGGGQDAEEDLFLAPVPRAAPSPPAAPEAVTLIPAASAESVGRNPFKARYVAPVAAPASEATGGEAAATPGGAESLPLEPVALPVQQPPVVVVQQPAPPQAPAEYPITLAKVEATPEKGTTTYTWTIDGKDLDVLQAQRFGKHGELVVLAFETGADGVVKAVLQVGDATPIRVAVGETVNVL